MCGILGSVPNSDEELFCNSLKLLEHRGPDGQGILHIEEQISLGHKRLAIIDLSSSGDQPISKFNRYHLIFNGEIYNYIEIKEKLELKGYKFKSKSDSEVLIYAFIEWGEDCVQMFNGMWAFAIWDSKLRSLFLSRDRIGEKPLYYCYEGDKFIFASEQKALLPFLREIEISSDFRNLVNNPYKSTSKTLFANIYKFPPAHNGIYQNNILKKSRYWGPWDTNISYPSKFSDQVEYLNYLLKDSCRLRLRSDVPIATALSGGIDSSTIATFVREIFIEQNIESLPQSGFNLSFPGSEVDENLASKKIAKNLGINLETIIVDEDQISQNLEKVCYLFEDIQEVNPLPHYCLYKNIKDKGFSVSLDGHGGDELFCGYESSILHALPDNLSNLDSLREIYNIYLNIHPKNSSFKGMRINKIPVYLAKEYIKNLFKKRDLFEQKYFIKLDSLSKHLFIQSFDTVLPTLLKNYDRYSMMSGVEIRMPILDYRIIEFAFSIPWQSKLRNGFTKSILREQIKNKIPNDIVYNKTKIGFAPPIENWLRGPLKKYILDEMNSSNFRNSRLINPKRLKKKISKIIFDSNKFQHYDVENVWKEFSTYLWEKIFLCR